MDLIDRLRAALDEDERIARAVQSAGSVGDEWPWTESYSSERVFTWVAHCLRHDPARVLRQVAAHRKVIALHAEALAERDRLDSLSPLEFEDHEVRDQELTEAWARAGVLAGVLEVLAEAYGIEP